MTIIMPKRNILDKILRWLGKERRIIIPQSYINAMQKGIDIYAQVRFESFWKALFRRSAQ
ncbi:MAG: hypothetical protein ACLFUU_10105 [Desulfobacteraceae bacterium]